MGLFSFCLAMECSVEWGISVIASRRRRMGLSHSCELISDGTKTSSSFESELELKTKCVELCTHRLVHNRLEHRD